MKWTRIGRTAVVAAFVLTFWIAASAGAVEPALSVSIDKDSVLVGDSVVLTVTVQDDPSPRTPEIGQVPGMKVRYRGTRVESFSSMTVIVQGKKVQEEKSGGGTHFDFELEPEKPGDYDVPSIPVSYKGRIFRTQPFRIKAYETSGKSDDVFVKLEADRPRVYLGEKVVVRVRWYFDKNISGYELKVPWLEGLKGFAVTDPDPDPRLRYQKLALASGQTVLGKRGSEFVKGREYVVIAFDKILTPVSTGSYVLDPVFLKCDVVKGYRPRSSDSFFGNFFDDDLGVFGGLGQKAVTQSVVTRSEPLKLEVLEVPRENAPPGYRNAVGVFEFDVAAGPLKVKAGEPVTLTAVVKGSGNLDELEFEPLGDLPDFRGYEPQVKITNSGSASGKKTFEKVLVPKSAGVFRIPELLFSYFDPSRGEFKTQKRGPFTVWAEEAPEDKTLPAASVRSDAGPSREEEPKKEITVLKKDIRYIKTEFKTAGTLDGRKLPWGIMVFAFLFPAAVVAAAWVLDARRRRLEQDDTWRRKRSACDRVRKALRALEASHDARALYDGLLKAMTVYLSDKTGRSEALVGPEFIRGAEGSFFGDAVKERLLGLWERCENALYSSSASGAVPRHEIKVARDLIRDLERAFK